MPAALDGLIVDNGATHKHARVKAWLAKRPRYHVHYTPTYMGSVEQVGALVHERERVGSRIDR